MSHNKQHKPHPEDAYNYRKIPNTALLKHWASHRHIYKHRPNKARQFNPNTACTQMNVNQSDNQADRDGRPTEQGEWW